MAAATPFSWARARLQSQCGLPDNKIELFLLAWRIHLSVLSAIKHFDGST